jgi:hypothetical protein
MRPYFIIHRCNGGYKRPFIAIQPPISAPQVLTGSFPVPYVRQVLGDG